MNLAEEYVSCHRHLKFESHYVPDGDSVIEVCSFDWFFLKVKVL